MFWQCFGNVLSICSSGCWRQDITTASPTPTQTCGVSYSPQGLFNKQQLGPVPHQIEPFLSNASDIQDNPWRRRSCRQAWEYFKLMVGGRGGGSRGGRCVTPCKHRGLEGRPLQPLARSSARLHWRKPGLQPRWLHRVTVGLGQVLPATQWCSHHAPGPPCNFFPFYALCKFGAWRILSFPISIGIKWYISLNWSMPGEPRKTWFPN